MAREEKDLALYCLKASSDYHSEVCEECIKYPNCDHTGQDDVTETIIKALEQEPKTRQYEKHIDHTDCIWYGSDSGCPVTCSQYRDGWNDAMDYIFKNGKGYQPYRHDV